MAVSPVQLLFVLLFAAGFYWCIAVIKRLPQDILELREAPDNTRKFATIFVWLLTLLIAIFVIYIAIPLIFRLIKSTYDVFTIS